MAVMCSNSNTPTPHPLWLLSWHGAVVLHTKTSLLTALPIDVHAVVAVLVIVVGCPLHLKVVWFAKHAGWSGYTTGMASETSLRH